MTWSLQLWNPTLFAAKCLTLVLGFALCFAIPLSNWLHAQENAKDASTNRASSLFTTRFKGAELKLPDGQDSFHFVVYGDRTGGVPEGLKVLAKAVEDTNLLAPDLVMTVGDLVQGYNDTPQWLEQAAEYKEIMNRLNMRWFPVAGNHDVYWRGEGEPPQGQHESNYEKHFGPLWYTFRHKNAGFIVLFADEGDRTNNEKGFGEARLQNMSEEQLDFLKKALKSHADADHVFVFLHHPRWIGGGYTGSNWNVVHNLFKEAGNVSAVFAGHIHSMRGDGVKDGIRYMTLATTGGNLSADIPVAGLLHHINVVRVRDKEFSVASLPVGATFDPAKFTQSYLDGIRKVRDIGSIETSNDVILNPDSSAQGKVAYQFKNDSPYTVQLKLAIDSVLQDWHGTSSSPSVELAPGASTNVAYFIQRLAGPSDKVSTPVLTVVKSFVAAGEEAPVTLPTERTPIPMKLSSVPADYFQGTENRSLVVKNLRQALRIESENVKIADGPFTVEGWFNPDQLFGSRGAVAKAQGSEFAIFINDGKPQFDVHLNGKYVSAKSPEAIPLQKWTHLAGVYDGKSVSIFVNGKKVAEKVGSGKRTPNSLPLYVGADPNVAGLPTRPFLGKIDEVRITNRAVYKEDFVPERRLLPIADTVLMLNLDRTFGPFLLDQSNSATHTTLTDGAELQGVLAP